ncbi:MAG: S41 family peptidase [Candidatus Nomurabacteria bacterium]|nr:S41 family peptidase [Candidatus Nomurabacteria bacterium]
MIKKFFNQKQNPYTILIIFGVFFFGIFIGHRNLPEVDKVDVNNKNIQVNTKADFAPFWKVWNTINEKYPDANKVSDQDKVYGAIKGLTDSLGDPYSTFFNPTEAKIFEDDIAGTFSGVGMEVGIKNKILTVIAPLKDTPAYKAGIKAGDKILKIDKKITTDLTIEQAIKLIRGEKGTTVSVTIFRDGEKEPREIKIIRDIINTPTIETNLRKDGIFVITLYSFSANSSNLFRDALKKFADSGSYKLVFDLRGNPGGYLDSAIDMASFFLPSSEKVVTEDYGGSKEPNIYMSKGFNAFNDKLRFVVLIDSGSASASEIFAGAMQDNNRAKLVGEQSYGKGSVQEVVDITPDTILKVTIAKWLTPKGTSISLKGLTPDFIVPMTSKDILEKKDPQMNKAVDLLNNWTPIQVANKE